MSQTQDPAPETRVGHTKADEIDVYAGRAQSNANMNTVEIPNLRGWLGNPYAVDDLDDEDIREDETPRQASIRLFREDFEARLEDDPQFRDAVAALAGKTLGCWCQSVDDDGPACHAEVIAEHADRLAREASES